MPSSGCNHQTKQGQSVLAYVISFVAGCSASIIFWLLRTPTPVPPVTGLVGLFGIAFGEIGTTKILDRLRRRRHQETEDPTRQ